MVPPRLFSLSLTVFRLSMGGASRNIQNDEAVPAKILLRRLPTACERPVTNTRPASPRSICAVTSPMPFLATMMIARGFYRSEQSLDGAVLPKNYGLCRRVVRPACSNQENYLLIVPEKRADQRNAPTTAAG